MTKKHFLIWILVGLCIVSFCGCRRIGGFYLSTSLTDTYLAAAKETALTAKEGNLIFMDYQNRYNSYYEKTGIENFWELSVSGYTFGEYLKEKRIKEEICFLLLLNDMAHERGIALDEQEQAICSEAASVYYSGLSDAERSFCQAKEEDVRSLYEKYRLAQKMIADLTDGVYLEISDNDKRVITIQILATGNRELAYSLSESLKAGGDFLQAAREYSTLSKIEYQVARGALNPVLEEVAFYLADGEVSDVIESENRYFLIKCIEDFDEELSASNEELVYRQSLYEQWSPALEAYAAGREVSFDLKLWSSMSFYETSAMTSANLYDVYEQYVQ